MLDRAVKHWIIAAALGNDGSLDALKEGYKWGLIKKKTLQRLFVLIRLLWMLRKSPQREEREAVLQKLMAEC
jgi:hypothetical protein